MHTERAVFVKETAGQNDIMKDLPLSLLSRGCGRIVSSNRNKGRHDGRLDVCFTPQDYYIWKSQDSVLKLSDRGRLLVKEKSTVPKTYSTRRGPLVLYSQDLITIENGCYPQTVRRQPVVQQHSQQVEQQLNILKEMTTAILSYSNKKFSFSRHGLPSFPPLRLSLAQDIHCSSPPPIPTTQESCQDFVERLNSQRTHSERNTKQLENHLEDEEEKQVNMEQAELDLLQEIPCTSRGLTPQVHVPCGSVTNEEEAQLYSDESLQHNGVLQHSEMNHHSKRAELHHPNLNHVHDSADNPGCFIQERETTNERGDYERSVSGNRHGTAGFLPPVTVENPVSQRPRWGEMDRATWGIPSRDGPHAQILPPIAENQTVVSSWTFPSVTKKDQPKAERVCLQSPKNLNQNHQQPLFLPPLFPEKKEEKNGKQREDREKTRRQHFLKEKVGGGSRGGGRLPSEKGSLIQLEPGEEPPPPVGVFGCVAGRRGPGKQSSLASFQNQLADLQDPCEHGEAKRNVVRGVLPLELRDLQNGKCVGCLILGPDGEIIQLSMYDKSQDQDQDQDPSQGDGDTSDKALQVLSAGEGLPWVIVLQPEHTFTVCAEGEVEPNTNVPVGNIQQLQSIEKLLDPHGLTETNTCSPINPKEQVFRKESKSAAAVKETWKALKKDPRVNVRMPPLRERVGEKEPGSHNSEAEDDGEEELGSTDLSGSQQPGEKLPFQENVPCSEQNMDINEETAERAVKKKRTDTTRKVADKAAITAGKKEIKPEKNDESDAQKKLRMKKEEKWQQQQTGSDDQLTQSQKQETTKDRERERGEVKMEEKREKQRQEERQKKESAERRRARLKHKELVVEKHEDPRENVHEKIKQETEEESHPTKQRHKNKTKTHSEEDADRLSNDGDKHGSVQSSGSLRSTAAASQFSHKSLRKSAVSLSEGTVAATGPASSRGRLSSCSTVMVTEEQLMLNPVKPESSRNRKSNKEEEAAALRLAEQEERQRQEVERKRMEREKEERKRLEKEQTEARMRSELEEERRKRAEELRLKRFAEEEEKRKWEEEEQEKVRQQQAQRERERRRQEDRRRQMEQLRLIREKEEQRRKAELERLRMEELRRQEEENKKLQEMDESERAEYLRRKEQEEEDRRTKDEERRRTEEEAALLAAEEAKLQADLLARQMALLQQQLAFKRSLELEAEGLEKTQGISRPWVYSYLTLLQLVGPTNAETTTL